MALPRLIVILAFILIASPLQADWGASFTPSSTAPAGDEECPLSVTWEPLDPAARDTYSIQFQSRSLSSLEDYGIEIIHGTDADPNSVIVGTPSTSGELVSFVLAPDTGCASAGCREGNWYSVHAQPVDSEGNKPVWRACLHVERKRYGKPGE